MNTLLSYHNHKLATSTNNNHFNNAGFTCDRLQYKNKKPLLTSTELFKSNKPKPITFSNNKQNTISHIEDRQHFITNKNTKQTNLKTSICENQKHLETDTNSAKTNTSNNKNNKKQKQVSIDLHNKYHKMFNNNNNKKQPNKDFVYTSPVPYEVNTVKSEESCCLSSTNSSMKKHHSSNFNSKVKRSLSRPTVSSKKTIDTNKPRSNTYYIKSKNYINSNNKNETNTNTNIPTAPQSQVFSSLTTFKTLFKINELEPKQLTSPSHMKELEELNKKLNLINQSNNINNQSTKFNVINASMLDNSNIKESTSHVNEEVRIASYNRLQTYKLLLDCINMKFSEIQTLVQNSNCCIKDNKSFNKMNSELHSKIEFSQNDNNVYDIEDYEMEEKTNVIVPFGCSTHSKTEPNDNMSMNSEMIKTFLEFNHEGCTNEGDSNIISFLSNCQNEIMSFLQPQKCNGNKYEDDNEENLSEISDVIIDNTNDTINFHVLNTFRKKNEDNKDNNTNKCLLV